MKISYSWLNDFIEIDWEAEKVAELLTDLGLEVEGIERFESIKGGLEGVVIGKVLTCDVHPNADRLKLTTVNIGNAEPVQIVCGAPNVAAGQTVAVATVGTTLYDKEKGPWEIKKSKIRGEESHGMICSEIEIGLGEDQDGIMVLEDELPVGKPLSEVFEVLVDAVFEIGLTPNRSDAMSHYGVARDLKAGLIQKEISKPLESPSISKFRVDNNTRHIPVEVLDSEKAPRYCGLTMSGVKVGESPLWLKNRLRAIGLNPINNVVDATNYVMHEIGQPFHAFDADRITGQRIIVKTVEEGTKFVTLDGVERVLSEEDLMICDEKKPLCIAGVYGGESAGVTENTNNIFLESAYFDPISIRKTAKRHGLNTDASFRFERGIDPTNTDVALKRLALLIQEVAGGMITSSLNDFYPKKIEGFQVFLRYDKINNLIGQVIDKNDLKTILASLNIRINNVTESGMGLTIPPFRTDVNREVDVVEEILRVYGYNRIDFNQKINATIALTAKHDDHRLQNIVGNQLVSQGFYEIMNNSLADKNHASLEGLEDEDSVPLLNPLSKELGAMRQSLIAGGLSSLAYNLNRQNDNLRLFEFGKSYHHAEENTYCEKKHFALFITGNQQGESWNSVLGKSSFFYMKGVLEAVFTRLGLEPTYRPNEDPHYAEALEIFVGEEPLGNFGVLKSKIAKAYDVDQEVLYADIDWDKVLERVADHPKHVVSPIPKYPSIRRDFALLLDKSVNFGQIEEIAHQTEKKLLKRVGLFDVYQGDSLPEGKKSYAVSFTFLDTEKTLTDKKVDKIMKKLRTRFEKELKAELR